MFYPGGDAPGNLLIRHDEISIRRLKWHEKPNCPFGELPAYVQRELVTWTLCYTASGVFSWMSPEIYKIVCDYIKTPKKTNRRVWYAMDRTGWGALPFMRLPVNVQKGLMTWALCYNRNRALSLPRDIYKMICDYIKTPMKKHQPCYGNIVHCYLCNRVKGFQ